MKIVIFANACKPDWREHVAHVKTAVGGQEFIVATDAIPCQPMPDLVIVLGGDGTMLHAAREIASRTNAHVPILGINRGKLGYLTAFTMEDVLNRNPHLLDAVKKWHLHVSQRMMLETDTHVESRSSESTRHLNDVVIRDPLRSIGLRVFIDGRELGIISGDGLIISSPTGSTAYNLSAGGPIMLPTSTGLILTPICPHALTFRPLIVPSTSVIKVVCETVWAETVAIIDGQDKYSIKQGQEIEVRASRFYASIVRHPERNLWHNLTTKLHWGAPNGE